MKLEKFDLEKALNGARVFTCGGLEVTQLTKFETVDKFNLYGVINNEVNCWAEDGERKDAHSNVYDLCLAVETKSIWVNVYKNKNGDFWHGSPCFPTFESAQNYVTNQGSQIMKACYIKTIEITDEV